MKPQVTGVMMAAVLLRPAGGFADAPVGQETAALPASAAATVSAAASNTVSNRVPQRVYADAFALWIYAVPRRSRTPIGYLRGGQSVALRDSKPVSFDDCKNGWYAIEPSGYVCIDQAASFQATHYHRAMQSLLPQAGPYPFEYGVSLGTAAYRRVPRANEQALNSVPIAATEIRLDELVTQEMLASRPMPWFLTGSGSVRSVNEPQLIRRQVPAQTLLSLVSRFDVDGQAYYQVADGTVVPADRLRLLRHSTFEGVWLGSERRLPMGFTRVAASTFQLSTGCAEHINRTPDATKELPSELPVLARECLQPTQRVFGDRVPVDLTGRRVSTTDTTWLETRQGEWVDESSLHVAVARQPRHRLKTSAQKWIHVSIERGTLVAYEGEMPVFVTLSSPGSGELNAKGGRRITPKGTYRINFKHLSDDMSSEDGEHRSEWKADVPYAMYFDQPYAIHVSYWHEAFGEPKSGGCINVSPTDGARLFDWTEPALPPGWYGVGSGNAFGLGTVVWVTD